MAQRRARPSGTQKDWGNLALNTRKRIAREARSAAQETISALQALGPSYSGEFGESWVAQPIGQGSVPNPGEIPSLYRANGPDMRRGYRIFNISPHAPQALDLKPGEFAHQEFEPEKTPVARGYRYGSMRGDVIGGAGSKSGQVDAISTAEPDWYINFASGGEFGNAVKQGILRVKRDSNPR
jgi:hypothetical protein